MKIKLTEKYRPFSHEAGTALLIPKSSWKVTAYPARLILENLISIGGKEILTILPQMNGPLESFTVMQDLEKGWVRIFGLGKKDIFHTALLPLHMKSFFLWNGVPKKDFSLTLKEK